jgi:hypothetical protein
MRYVQPSLFSKPTRATVWSFFKTGDKKVVQRKTKSGGTHAVGRKFRLGGSLFDRKSRGRLR